MTTITITQTRTETLHLTAQLRPRERVRSFIRRVGDSPLFATQEQQDKIGVWAYRLSRQRLKLLDHKGSRWLIARDLVMLLNDLFAPLPEQESDNYTTLVDDLEVLIETFLPPGDSLDAFITRIEDQLAQERSFESNRALIRGSHQNEMEDLCTKVNDYDRARVRFYEGQKNHLLDVAHERKRLRGKIQQDLDGLSDSISSLSIGLAAEAKRAQGLGQKIETEEKDFAKVVYSLGTLL
jgi:hypothetical protein